MERVFFAEHEGRAILNVDYSRIDDPEELRGVARRALAIVQAQPERSVLVLADLTGVPHSMVTAAIMQQGVAESRPHVRARAVVGLAPEAAASFDVARRLFDSPMEGFADRQSAREWLLRQP